MTLRLLIALASLTLLSACATMDEDQCRSADWYDIGVRDGLAGEPASQLAQHRKACAEYGVRPHEQRYQDGRAEGLREYCRLGNAIDSGLKGRQYQGVCPAHRDRDFRYYNDAAYAVYQLRNEVESTHASIEDKEHRLRDRKLGDDQRAELRNDIRRLDRKLDRLRDDLRDRERELDRLSDEARRR
jgi:hypothetical protein